MCGILGLIQKREKIDPFQFKVMLNTLEKRGLDSEGMYLNKNIGLGHRRLSIIDLSDQGKQPMANESNDLIITFNGEIYNYLKVKNRLSDKHVWKSRTDTEVLLHAYEDYGLNILKHIEGMFAFAIYDRKKKMITLARDHFGKKPLYYYLDEEIFCFASEIKAIIKDIRIKKKLKIDQMSLCKYLIYGYVPSPNSIFDKIKKLEPSTAFQFDISNWKIINKSPFWNLEKIEISNNLSEEDVIENTERLIKTATKKRLMSDVPLGIFLSGGVDSSLISTYMAQNSQKVNSFTVGYEDYLKEDESEYAIGVAKKLGIKYDICHFESSLVEKTFLEILDYLDEPMADAAIIPLYFISKYAKKSISVVLSGDGGDEVFGGYLKYRTQEFIEKFKYLNVVASVGKNFISKNSSYYKLLDSFRLPFSQRQFIFGSGSFSRNECESLLNKKKIDYQEIFKESFRYEELFKQKDLINKSLYLDVKIQLPDWYLVKGDRATMANSLEMRNPFLDKELVEFAFSLSGNWKIRSGEQKYLLKIIASRYIDKEIIYREKKGFGVPLDKWIRKELRSLFKEYLFIKNDFFDIDYIEKIYKEHIDNKYNHQFELLRIFNFNYWYKKYASI